MSSKITAPRGTADLLPPDSARWQEVERRAHDIAARYGYGEVRTPMFESTELFVRGVGETTDIVEKEMYTFLDKGDRSMTLRPEWTAPVMRAALQHGLIGSGPQRLYYLGPIFRYERPQAGRYRQSHQFGVECVGFAGPEADVEVIALAADLIRSYALPGVVLNVNSIGDEHCRPKYRDALLAHFRPHAAQLSAESQRRLERNPLRILDSKAAEDAALVQDAPAFETVLCGACREHFDAVKHYLKALDIAFVVNPRIVRGLDYYTRTVFEFVSDALGAQSTLCAGGRYDGLVKALGGSETPAVGFALGLERFVMTLDAAGGLAQPARAGIQVIALGAQARERMLPILADLRRLQAEPVFADYADRKLLSHLKAADRNGARFALILGSDELAAGIMVLRDLGRREDRNVPLGSGKDVIAALVELER